MITLMIDIPCHFIFTETSTEVVPVGGTIWEYHGIIINSL